MKEIKKRITLDGMGKWHLLLIASAIGMICVSAYLMAHYVDAHYPSGMGKNMCNISGFFSCDAAAYSFLSNIFGIPISLFGLLAGLFLIISSIFPSEKMEGTNHFLLRLNLIGCLLLFILSLIFIRKLCPFCTLYYLFSALALFAFYRGSDLSRPSIKVLSIYLLATLFLVAGYLFYIQGKVNYQEQMGKSTLIEFTRLADLGNPSFDSPYRLDTNKTSFKDAPLQVTIFSDFECPACAKLVEVTHKLLRKYGKQLNVQFFFYPLDRECNMAMERDMHIYACKASYLAAASEEQFAMIHDAIFEKGTKDRLSDSWLDSYAKSLKLFDKMNDPMLKEKVVAMIGEANNFNIRSTPTILVNGRKIEGVLPLAQFYAIFDHLLSR